MSTQTLVLSILAASMTLSDKPAPSALATLTMVTQYAFDPNVVLKVMAIDEKTAVTAADPLSNLLFKIAIEDKVDGSEIARLQGRMYTGGGVEALETKHPSDSSYIMSKLDFYGALDSEYDFFEEVVTQYSAGQADQIKAALASNKILNNMGDYRTKEKVLAVPATSVATLNASQLKKALMGMRERPRYIATVETGNLTHIEAIAEVCARLNCHSIIDIGPLVDWRSVVGMAEAFSLNDHRAWLFWNPNKSRPSNATTALSRKKWRPCVGDFLAQSLIRNAASNASGVAPIDRPISGYDFPLNFRDMEVMDGVDLDEEAQNALAKAGVNVVLNEQFEGGDRWVYGDVLTQYDSKTSALRLINAAEIETASANLVVSIVKKHLLKAMSSFIRDATDECTRALDACAIAGWFTPSSELGGLYYAIEITRRTDDPFTKADVEFIRRPEGCARQVYLKTTVTK